MKEKYNSFLKKLTGNTLSVAHDEASPLAKGFVWTYLTFLLCVFIVICTHGAGGFHYSADEVMHVNISQGTPLREILHFSLYETHPPLGYILRHYWMQISEDPAFVRSLSLIFGSALILVYYQIGKMLHNAFAGVLAATLIAFSHGVILQSYVVRNYTIFLFFLSLGFYYYILWQKKRSTAALSGYGICAALACLTHFSGIFTVFCIAAYDFLRLRTSKAPQRRQWEWEWILVNLSVAAMTAFTSWVWRSSHLIDHYQFPNWKHSLVGMHIVATLVYLLPPMVINGQLFIYIWVPLFLFGVAYYNQSLRPLTLLTFMALGLSGFLFISNIYPLPGNRHNLWLLPLLIPTLGCALACTVTRLIRRFTNSPLWSYALAICFMGACIVTYNPAERFTDNKEYTFPEQSWQNMTHYLDTLPHNAIIVAGRADTFLLTLPEQNFYRYMGDDIHGEYASPILLPHHNTQILSDIFYLRIDEPYILTGMMQKAEEEGLLKDADTLLLINTLWTSQPIVNLMTCKALERKIITFPIIAHGAPFTEEEITSAPASFLVVSKKDFFEQVIAPSGKAHDCLMKTDR